MAISLTRSRRKRIRQSDADGIAWMVDKEHYWSPEALREILKRIEVLCHEDSEEAVAAGRSALRILETRVVDPSPRLQAWTLATYGSTLRIGGRLEEARRIFEQALQVKNLGNDSKSDVLVRMTTTLICLGRLEEGLSAIDTALDLKPHQPVGLAVRGWVHLVSGNFPGSLRDCLEVIARSEELPPADLSVFSSIVNAAACLSFEAGVAVDGSVFEKLRLAIQRFRTSIASGGSNFYKFQRIRYMLSRSEALILARVGKIERAIAILRAVTEGLQANFPDDALDASIDLMGLLAKRGAQMEAAVESRRTLTIAESTKVRPDVTALNVLRTATKQESLSSVEVAELRIRLRTRKLLIRASRKTGQVA